METSRVGANLANRGGCFGRGTSLGFLRRTGYPKTSGFGPLLGVCRGILRRLRPAVPPGTVYFASPQRMPILTIQLYRLKAEYWVGAQSWVGARSMPLGAASVGAAAPR